MVETSTVTVTEPAAPAADTPVTDASTNDDVRSRIHDNSHMRDANACPSAVHPQSRADVTGQCNRCAGVRGHVQRADQEGKGPGQGCTRGCRWLQYAQCCMHIDSPLVSPLRNRTRLLPTAYSHFQISCTPVQHPYTTMQMAPRQTQTPRQAESQQL